jgi:hypothetical protein
MTEAGDLDNAASAPPATFAEARCSKSLGMFLAKRCEAQVWRKRQALNR